MKKYFLLAIFISFYINVWCIDTLSVCSPSGKICVKIWMEKILKYRIYDNGNSILEPSAIDMILENNKIKVDFLDNGDYKATICKDGVNADRYAADYILVDTTVKKNDEIKVHLAREVVFLIRLEKQ
jgi:hypothetical protein